MKKAIGAFAAGLAVSSTAQAFELDPMKHDIRGITKQSFPVVISKLRDSVVAAVWYYYPDERADADFLVEYNDAAVKTKDMVTIGAMDCSNPANASQCKSVGVTKGSGPHIVMYPNLPMPEFKYEGTMTADKITAKLFKLIDGNNVKRLKKESEYKDLMKKNPTKPKVVLVSDKKGPPTMIKALSKDQVYQRTIEFAFVSTTDGQEVIDAIAKEKGGSKVKKSTPALFLVTKGEKLWYSDKEFSYQKLSAWMNPYSESGMGDSVKGAEGVEPDEAEYERIRELTWKSQRDLCFGQKNVCAVYVKSGPIEDKETDMLSSMESKFQPKSDRGVNYSWMWLDISAEPEFLEVLKKQEADLADNEGRDVEELKFPTMLFIKPPKQKRQEKQLAFLRMENGVDVEDDSVKNMCDKVSGGATYKRVPIPKFATRPKKDAKKPKEGKTEL